MLPIGLSVGVPNEWPKMIMKMRLFGPNQTHLRTELDFSQDPCHPSSSKCGFGHNRDIKTCFAMHWKLKAAAVTYVLLTIILTTQEKEMELFCLHRNINKLWSESSKIPSWKYLLTSTSNILKKVNI